MTSRELAIARRLPDLPRWVEARALLLAGECELFGLREEPELSFALRDPVTGLVFVVGAPELSAVRTAVDHDLPERMVIALPEQTARLAEALPGWSSTRARLHRLPDLSRLPAIPPGSVRFVDPAILPGLGLPAELLWELQIGAEGSLIAATFVDESPVSFCYAGAITESLWDVAIDTLAEHRGRGHAGLCAAFMIRYMLGEGKLPVWGAVDENPASWRLAARLGFVPVDELVLMEPPP